MNALNNRTLDQAIEAEKSNSKKIPTKTQIYLRIYDKMAIYFILFVLFLFWDHAQ